MSVRLSVPRVFAEQNRFRPICQKTASIREVILVWMVKMTTMGGYENHTLPDLALPAGMWEYLRAK